MEKNPDLQEIPRHRRILFLSIPYLFVALLIFGIEGGTRLFWPYVPPLDVLIDAPSLRQDLAENKDSPLFIADPLLFWRVRPHLKEVYWDFTAISTNAQGLRHDGDIGKKSPDSFRIVCLGDSVVFGFRVPMAFPNNPHDFDRALFPYPESAEKKLREANPGKLIEVIPLAVPSYTTHQGLSWLKRDIDFLKPDIVTACFGWNDVCLRPIADRQSMPMDFAHVIARGLLIHSQAVTHFAKWRHSKPAKGNIQPGPPVARVSLADYTANLVEIFEVSRAHGAQTVLIGPVYRDARSNPAEAALVRQYRDALRTAAQAHEIPYLEIRELIETNYPANDRLFGELIHPNAAGHEIMASTLLKFLAEHKMLDSLQLPESLSSE
jgi:lysophospholipase L1-like esterase